jgi:hypothetical protein
MDIMLHERSHAPRRDAAASAAPMKESPGE